MKKSSTGHVLSLLCVAGLVLTCGILGAALYVQFVMHEAPCPLCLLQRAAFFGMAIGLLMNLRFGENTAYWASVILCALTGMAVSLRQIALHVTSPIGFGSPFLGYHMYTWCFIGFATATVLSSLILMAYPQSVGDPAKNHSGDRQ